jgi:hypothetical protein
MKLHLAPPFAFVAAAPFVLLGRPLDACLAAAAMGLAGAAFRGSKVVWWQLLCVTAVLGGVAGMLAGSFAAGVALGLCAMLPLRLVAWAAEDNRARRGSLVDALDVRQAWTVAAYLVTIVPATVAFGLALPGLVWVNGAGLLIVMCVTAADVRALVLLRRLTREAAKGTATPLAPVQRDVPITDVGVGEQQHELRVAGAPYRGSAEVISVVRGDVTGARGITALRLLFDAVLLAISTALLMAALRV